MAVWALRSVCDERVHFRNDRCGELVATPFAGGISVDINLPDGKGSGQLAFIEAAPEGLRDDYPTLSTCSRMTGEIRSRSIARTCISTGMP